jgi:hypothetical protein
VETPGVKMRVRRLVELAASDRRQFASTAPLFRLLPWLALTAFVVIAVLVESRPQVLAAVHSVLEQIVRILS